MPLSLLLFYLFFREEIIGLQGVNFKRRSGVNSIFRSTSQNSIFGLAENQADCGLVSTVPELVVHHRAIEVHFAGILWFKVTLLQFNDYKTAQFEVVE